MKLKKLSATFRDPEHGEKARPLGPEVKKRGTTEARDDYSAYLLSNQKANAQPLDEDDPITSVDPPPPVPEGGPDEPPQLPPAYIQAVDAFENAIAAQGGNMDADGSGTLDVLDVSAIIDFFMTIVGQSPAVSTNVQSVFPNNLFWFGQTDIPAGGSFENSDGLFYSPGQTFNDGAPYFDSTDGNPIPESLLTWADYMELAEDAPYPIPLNWQAVTFNQSAGGDALSSVFDAYEGDVPEDFFDTLLMNPQPTEADLEDLGAWFDNNMLPIMNIYADVFMYNATGGENTLGYNGGNNFQEMMDYIESTGGGLGNVDFSVNDSEYNPFSGNIFDVNNDGTFDGADIAAWVDFTEMISVVTSGGSISETNNVFSQEDIDQIVAYYEYYDIEMAGGNLFFSTDGEWIDTQNVANINNPAENPPFIFDLLDSGEVEAYQDEIAAAEQAALLQQGWVNSRPVWGEAFGLSADLQSETPEWYIAFANAIQPWLDAGYDPGYSLDVTNISGGNSSAQISGYNEMLSNWVGQNLFDPDGDGQWSPDELTAEANLVLDWLSTNPFITEAQTPEAFAALELENLIGNLIADNPDWVASVGGLPPWANIIGQEAGEAFNYNAQVGALLMLASNFGNHVDPSNVSGGLYGDFPQDFFAYLGYDASQSAELSDYFNTGGLAADQGEFSNWLQLGFDGIGILYENADGNIVLGNTGQGVLWSAFDWGGDFNDSGVIGSGISNGPSGSQGIQFYNFNVDINAEGFLYGYVAAGNQEPFYPPPALPTLSTPPVPLVTPGLLFGDSSLDSTNTGLYMDIQNFVDRTGGFMDFANDGQIGLSDWFALHQYAYTQSQYGTSSLFLASIDGYGWGQIPLAFVAQVSTQELGVTTDFGWWGAPNSEWISQQPGGSITPEYWDATYFNPYGAENNPYSFQAYVPEVALANFLIFQYVNDYVSNNGVAPNWYAQLTQVGYSTAQEMFSAIDPSVTNVNGGDYNFSFDGTSGGGTNYFVNTVLPYLQQAMPAYEDLAQYAQYYLDSGVDINEVFVGLEGETTPIFTSSGELGTYEGGSLVPILQSVSSQNYWIGFTAANPGLLSALASIGDGNGSNISGALASQYEALAVAMNNAGFSLISVDAGRIDLGVLALWLEFNGGSPVYSALNQMLEGLGYQGEPTAAAYANAIYALMQPFVDAGIFTATVGNEFVPDSGPEQGYTLTFASPPGNSLGGADAGDWIGYYTNFVNNFVIDGILGTAVLGATNGLYLNEEGVVTPIGEGGFGSGLYQAQVNNNPTAYAQVIELINQFGDIDFNGDGVYNEADVQYLLNLVGTTQAGSAQEVALDLNDDGIFNDEDVLLFTSFFGGSGDFSFGQFGYYDIPEGESVDEQYWVDFDFDSYTNEYYGYNAVSAAPPPPPAP